MMDWTPPTEVCSTIPANTQHAVSVTLPTWAANVAYEEGESWIADKMTSGYPRFCIHYKIKELAAWLEETYARDGESCMIFPAFEAADRCRAFIKARADVAVRVVQLATPYKPDQVQARIAVAFFPGDLFPLAKQYWQHTGEGISSRQAVYFLEHSSEDSQNRDQEHYVEERFGRNLDLCRADEAKSSLQARIAGHLASHNDGVTKDQIFLYPTGMTAIYSAHLLSMAMNKSVEAGLKSVCYGFPYTDTLKVLEKWGPGAIFLPRGSEEELDELERNLAKGDRIAALVCEFPSNPLLRSPNIVRIYEMSRKYNFLVAVDDTVGNMSNINALPYADMTVASLTKIFSGDCNVMAGVLILNHKGPNYERLLALLSTQYKDTFWAEDTIYLERNSRDFVPRSRKTNENAQAVVGLLKSSSIVRDVYYPRDSDTMANYDRVKVPGGGYGGLLSVVFREPQMSMAFFDAIQIAKGPSLGTNFTLACPYTIIAHYNELDFVESCGVDRYLVRISVGLEETEDLLARFRFGLEKAAL